MSREIVSQIRLMQQLEISASYRCTDYIASPHNEAAISCLDRKALCDWGFSVITTLTGISRATAVVAILYFDRFLGSSTSSAKRALSDTPRLQLAFVACLVIALKVKAGLNVESQFVSGMVCNDMYAAEEINDMEIEILQALRWKLNGPTAHDFIDYFFEEMPYWDEDGIQKKMAKSLSKTLVESAVTEYKLALQLPSQIAFAAISYTLDYTTPSSFESCLAYLCTISGIDSNDVELRSARDDLRNLVIRSLLSDYSPGILAERRRL